MNENINFNSTKLIDNEICVLYKKCAVTNKVYSITVPANKYMSWEQGNYLIQDVFPDLKPEEREFMISGLTPDEFNHLFKEEE